MSFNSWTFGFFLLVVWVLYRRLGHRQQNEMLLVASYFFYGCWDWRFLGLIFATTLIDYKVAQILNDSQSETFRRWLLGVSIGLNIGLLAFFKYFGFFSSELQNLLELLGLGIIVPRLDVILPVGISFYTFQTMSYTIDVYRRELQPQRNFVDFALYVAYFPQLVAGPIERAGRLLPQITSVRTPLPNAFSTGLYCILYGLFKKIFVADSMAVVANGVFGSPIESLTAIEVLLGVYAFAIQIYCDFSGYSLIAQGVSKWFDIELMDNFHSPYFSTDPSEFWRRWHISLSEWLRDYVYIPLGGNRKGEVRTYLNLMTTMVLGGLWHGANWTFVAWGAYHGLLLCIYRKIAGRRSKEKQNQVARWLNMFLFFHLVCFGWLLFRANSMHQVVEMMTALQGVWRWTPLGKAIAGMLVFYAGPLILYEWFVGTSTQTPPPLSWHWSLRALLYIVAIELMVFFAAPVPSQFIYFQF